VQGWLRGRAPHRDSSGRTLRRMRTPHGSSLSHRVRAFRIRPRQARMPTMPSADFCSITPRVAPCRAAGALGSGGQSRPFGLGLSPAPMAVGAALGSGGRSRSFDLGLSPAPMAASGRSSSRSPRIRACTVAAQPRHLPYPPNHRASTCCAASPQGSRPSRAFVFLGSQLCRGLPSDDPSRGRPCRKLVILAVHSVGGGSLTGDFHPVGTCPCRAYTSHSTGRFAPVNSVVWRSEQIRPCAVASEKR
jgi:hypothetical protein